jgi:hypothetical protein
MPKVGVLIDRRCCVMSIISVLLLIIALISIASLGFSLLVISGEYTFLSRRNGYLLGIFILIILSG